MNLSYIGSIFQNIDFNLRILMSKMLRLNVFSKEPTDQLK